MQQHNGIYSVCCRTSLKTMFVPLA